jgi:hypothetical protein
VKFSTSTQARSGADVLRSSDYLVGDNSGSHVATLVGVTGLVIYFSIAAFVLRGTLV